MPFQLRNFATVEEPAAKKIKLGVSVQSAPLGLNIALGSMAPPPPPPLSEAPLHEQSMLDISCGTGTFLGAVEGKVASVTGLEYNNGMIAQAKTLLGDSVKLVQGSADALTEFADASVDFCTMDQVFMVHHFSSDDNYAFCACSFQEAYRVLKPGGVFVLNTSMPEQQRDAFWWLSLFPKSSEASEAICARSPSLEVFKSHLKFANFEFDADSVAVPLHRSLMTDSKYLEHGVKAGFMPEHRAGDPSLSMAENFGELDGGSKKLQGMIVADKADYSLEGGEQLRRSMGQATFLTLRKPLKL